MSIENDESAGPASGPSETARQHSGTQGGAWRWAIGAVVVLLLAYPLVRLMMGRGGAADIAQPPPGAGALQQSFEHFQAGRYGEAVVAAKAAIVANPNEADAYNNLAVSHMKLGQVDEALQAIQEALRLRPDDQLAKNNLAWFQQEKAKAALPPVPAAQAGQASALLTQSLQHFQAGRFKECMDAARQSATLNPSSADAFNNIGICAGSLRLWDEAIRNTQEAIRLRPDFQLAKNNLAWMLQQRALPAGKAP